MEKALNTNNQKQFGVFETMRFINGRINLEDFHFERLFDGLEKLKINKAASFSIEKIRKEITDLCKKNNCYQKERIRLSVTSPFDYSIETFPFNDELNKEGLVIDIFPGEKKKCDAFSNLKLTDRSLYENAEKFAVANKLDDALILNEYDRICESTISNIFWIRDRMIYTPPLSEGCVAGVMRRFLMEKMRDAGYGIREQNFAIEELFETDEVFLTNGVRGIRWIKSFRDKVYSNSQTLKIKNDLLPESFFS